MASHLKFSSHHGSALSSFGGFSRCVTLPPGAHVICASLTELFCTKTLLSVQAGNIPDSEMYRTFNMGIGMVVVVPQDAVEAAQAADPEAIVLGQVVKGKEVQMQ